MKIRHPNRDDFDALAEISLRTGDAGKDATPLHSKGPRLIGEIYSLPYVALLPEWGWVAEDSEGVVGFVVGAPDTRAFEAQIENEWYPRVRETYPNPTDLPADWSPEDRKRLEAIFQPSITQDEIVTRFPGHMHMNLLSRARGHGLGRKLANRFFDKARENGVPALHVGVSPTNSGGEAFWHAVGFRKVLETKRTLWMGLKL